MKRVCFRCKRVCFSLANAKGVVFSHVTIVQDGLETRRKCLVLYSKGFSVRDIHARLEEIFVSTEEDLVPVTEEVQRAPYSVDLRMADRKAVLTVEQVRFLDREMELNDEYTARKLHEHLLERWPD